jgi:hypothetical protein
MTTDRKQYCEFKGVESTQVLFRHQQRWRKFCRYTEYRNEQETENKIDFGKDKHEVPDQNQK